MPLLLMTKTAPCQPPPPSPMTGDIPPANLPMNDPPVNSETANTDPPVNSGAPPTDPPTNNGVRTTDPPINSGAPPPTDPPINAVTSAVNTQPSVTCSCKTCCATRKCPCIRVSIVHAVNIATLDGHVLILPSWLKANQTSLVKSTSPKS